LQRKGFQNKLRGNDVGEEECIGEDGMSNKSIESQEVNGFRIQLLKSSFIGIGISITITTFFIELGWEPHAIAMLLVSGLFIATAGNVAGLILKQLEAKEEKDWFSKWVEKKATDYSAWYLFLFALTIAECTFIHLVLFRLGIL